jgi:hypothetical protein
LKLKKKKKKKKKIMTKYQNYSNYKLPITINPLEYGKLIEQFDNKFIIQLNTNNIVVIKQIENENYVKLFRKGNLIFEFRDIILSDNNFIRTISDTRFTFKDNKLISTEIVVHNKYIKIFESKLIKYDSLNTPSKINNIFKFLENTVIFKNYKAELFIVFELFLIFLVYLICFVIFPEDNIITNLAVFPFKNKILNWIDYKFDIKNKVFTRDLLNSNLNKFWSEIIIPNVNENQHIWLLFRLRWANGEYVTIGKLQKLNIEDKDYLLNLIIEEMEDKSEYYKTTNIIGMIFSYNIRKGRAKDKIILENNINLQYQDFEHHKFPITINPLEYGILIRQKDNEYWVQINKTNSVIINQIDNNINEVKFYRSGKLKYTYSDRIINDNTFIRSLDNKQFTFKNNELVLLTIDKSVKFIDKLIKTRKSD